METPTVFSKFQDRFALVIPIAFVISVLVYFCYGRSSNFQGNNSSNLRCRGIIQIIYRRLHCTASDDIAYHCVDLFTERYYTIKKPMEIFLLLNLARLKEYLAKDDIQGAKQSARVQGLRPVLQIDARQTRADGKGQDHDQGAKIRYTEVLKRPRRSNCRAWRNICLPLPPLLPGNTVGTVGNRFRMIRSFAAMANAGAPDSVALATGISEALVNTAFGIGSAAMAMVAYGYFTTRIDKLTYAIDEAGYSIAQTFAAKH